MTDVLKNFTLKGLATAVSISSKSISKKTGRVTRPKLEQNTNAVNIRRPFDPTAHELDANFRLTRFADLKGRGCKVPQEVLLKLLEGLADDGGQQDEQHFMAHMSIPRIGTFCPNTNCKSVLLSWVQKLSFEGYNPLKINCDETLHDGLLNNRSSHVAKFTCL